MEAHLAALTIHPKFIHVFYPHSGPQARSMSSFGIPPIGAAVPVAWKVNPSYQQQWQSLELGFEEVVWQRQGQGNSSCTLEDPRSEVVFLENIIS